VKLITGLRITSFYVVRWSTCQYC